MCYLVAVVFLFVVVYVIDTWLWSLLRCLCRCVVVGGDGLLLCLLMCLLRFLFWCC